jgi:hypothetical protein
MDNSHLFYVIFKIFKISSLLTFFFFFLFLFCFIHMVAKRTWQKSTILNFFPFFVLLLTLNFIYFLSYSHCYKIVCVLICGMTCQLKNLKWIKAYGRLFKKWVSNETRFLILGSKGSLWRLDATIVMEISHGKSFVLPFLYICDNFLFYAYQKKS